MLYPGPSKAAVQLQYVGKDIADVQAPAAIVDAAVIRRNCKLMLDAAEKLGVGFRAHVKTHKVFGTFPCNRRYVVVMLIEERGSRRQR